MRKSIVVSTVGLTALALSSAHAQRVPARPFAVQPFAVQPTLIQPAPRPAFSAEIKSGGAYNGLGLEAEIPLSNTLRATVGVGQDRFTGGAKVFVNGDNYLGGAVSFASGGVREGTALVGHRFDARSFYLDVEGGLNFKNFGPTVGVGFGIKF